MPKATRLPDSVTPPISPEAAVAIDTSVENVSVVVNSAPATRNDAAPPNPLSSATISGMDSIFTVRASHTPIPEPTAIAAIDRAQHAFPGDSADTDLHVQASVRVMALYEHRLDDRGGTAIDAATLRKADHAERELRLAGLDAERRTIYELARHRRISDEVARRLVREIDLLETRYRT